MMAAVVLSTLAMLVAVDGGRKRWWVVHAAAVAVAVYSHYTCVFVFAAQLAWVLWAHPQARRAALAATAGAIVLFLPWSGGLVADVTSPTTKILAALSPFDWPSVRFSLSHWIIGYPAAIAFGLRDFPGVFAVVLVALAIALASGSVLVRVGSSRRRHRVAGQVDRRLILIVLLALSAPVAQAALNLVGTHLFSVRNFAASWPGAILALSALLIAAGPRLRVIAATMALAGFTIAAVQLVLPRFQNPDYRGAARYVDRAAGGRDVVIDASGELSPGPVTGLDVELRRPHRVLRAAAPEVRDHPFTLFDPVVTTREAIRRGTREAAGHRVFLVSTRFSAATARAQVANVRTRARRDARFPPPWHVVDQRAFPGVLGVVVRVYAQR